MFYLSQNEVSYPSYGHKIKSLIRIRLKNAHICREYLTIMHKNVNLYESYKLKLLFKIYVAILHQVLLT